MLKFTGLSGEAGTTRRKIFGQAFSVWDPRGLVLPFTIRSKIILQNLNHMKYSWDDDLREADLREWREWHSEAAALDEIKIPRAFLGQMKAARETSFHVFCHSSQDTYGACAYLRREFEDTTVECRLVAGKGRVAPLKTQSICRLELMGALLAARLAEILTTELTMKIERITFWSDSTTVLHWIGQTSSSYKAFAGNRVSEIHTIMSELVSTLRLSFTVDTFRQSATLLMTSPEDYAQLSSTLVTSTIVDLSFYTCQFMFGQGVRLRYLKRKLKRLNEKQDGLEYCTSLKSCWAGRNIHHWRK